MVWILDCSFAAALFLPDEKSGKIASFFNRLSEDDHVAVMSLWWHEISNVLVVSVRRKRLSHADVINVLELIKEIGVATDSKSGPGYAHDLFELSQLYQLSAYDAAYLELALRMEGSLATMDEDLIKAARMSGVEYCKIK